VLSSFLNLKFDRDFILFFLSGTGNFTPQLAPKVVLQLNIFVFG
jgi:hypothetical protein